MAEASGAGPGRPRQFGIIGLLAVILGVAVAWKMTRDGWAAGGMLGAIGGLGAGLLLGLLMVPVVGTLIWLLLVAGGLTIVLLMHVASRLLGAGEPAGPWRLRIRTFAVIVVVAALWPAFARAIIPLGQTPEDRRLMIAMAVIVPAGLIAIVFEDALRPAIERRRRAPARRGLGPPRRSEPDRGDQPD